MDSIRSSITSVTKAVAASSDFEAIYASLKPANLLNILTRFFKTSSWRERCGCVIQLLELYGCFWATKGGTASALTDCVAYAIYRLPTLFVEFKEFVQRLTTRTPQSNEQFVSHNNPTPSTSGAAVITPTANNVATTSATITTAAAASASSPSVQDGVDEARVESFFSTCSDYVKGLWTTIKTMFAAHKETLYSVTIIVLPIVMILGCFLGTSFGTGARVCASIIACGNVIRNWKIITDGFSSLRTLISETTASMFGLDVHNKFKEELATKIQKLKIDVDKKNSLLDTDLATALDDSDFIISVEKDLKEIDALYIEVSTTDKNLCNFRFQMEDVRNAANELQRKYRLLMTSVTGKVHPTVLWLYGNSGVGKSHCVEEIIRGLQQQERRTMTKFTRQCGDQYWSGYCGEDVVIYDDFGADNENIDHVELDAIYSSANYPLNMADIGSKGKRFVSPYVIICSNFPFIEKSKRLLMPSILNRRRDLLFHVDDRVADQYRSRGRVPPPEHYEEDYSHAKFREFALAPHNGSIAYTGREWGLGAIIQEFYRTKTKRVDVYKKQLEGVCQSFRDGIVEDTDKYNYPTRISIVDPAAWAKHTEVIPDDDDVVAPDDELSLRPKDTFAKARSWLQPRADELSKTGKNLQKFVKTNKGHKIITSAPPPVMFDKFEDHSKRRLRTILLMGDASTRKTTIAESLVKKFPHVEFIDEFCTRLIEVEERVWKQYDNYEETDIPMILCCNSTTLRTEWNKHHSTDPQRMDAFMRRCVVFNFEIQHGLFTKRVAADITSETYSKYVKIQYLFENGVRGVMSSTMEVFSCAAQYLQTVPVPVPVMNNSLARIMLPPEIDYIVSVDVKVDDVGNSCFEDFKMMKGSAIAIMALAPQLMSLRSRRYACCADALVDFNEAKVKFDKVALLQFKDANFIFKPNSFGVSEAFHLDSSMAAQVEEVAAQNVRNVAQNSVLIWVDMLLYFVKTLAVSYFCTYYPEEQKMRSEGNWADEPEDKNWTTPMDLWSMTPASVPKSRVGTRDSQKEYCEFHHTLDYCFQTESRTVRRLHEVYDQGPSNVVQDVLKSETSDEEDQRKRPIQRFKVQNETSDEEDQRKRPITRFKTGNDEPRSVPKIPLKNYMMNQATCVATKNEVLEDQSSYDPQALTIAMVFNDNIITIGNRDVPSLCGIMLCSRLGVTNAHVDYTMKVGDQLQVNTQTETWTAKVISINWLRDLCFFTLPSTSRQFRNITAHLMPRGEIKDFSNLAGLMITRRKEIIIWRALQLQMEKTIDIEQRKRHGLIYSGTCTGMSYSTMLTERGDCGSPVIVLDPTRKQKLLGFHSAASAMTGLGTLLYLEDLPDGDFGDQSRDDIVILPHQAIKRVEMDDYKLFKVIGKAYDGDKPLKQFHPTTTKLYKSPFNGFMEKQYEPSIMSHRDTRIVPGSANPYEDAMDKWSHEQPIVDMDELKIVTQCVADYLGQKVFENDYKVSVLTKTEAINGVSNIPASNPIYLRSSAGYPFKHWEGVTKKGVFFEPTGPNGTYVIAKTPLGQKLNVCVDALIDTARKGQRSAVVFCGSLKDESLKLKKIYGEKRATRSFAGSPVDYTLAHRMYFHGAMAAMASIHDQIPPQVGIDPCSVDWHQMCRRLTAVSDHGFDVDFSGWDATVPRVFMEALPQVYNTIYQYCDPNYKPEDDRVRTHLHSVLHGPLVMYYDTIVQCPGGQVSGQPATSMDNCIVNMLYHYYIWRRLAKEHAPDKVGYTAFIKNVASAFYGDDDITTVSAECMPWFNLLTFQQECIKLGLTVTDALKTTTTELVPIKPLMEMNFLKRNFTRQGKFIVGALEDCVFAKMTEHCRVHKGHDYYLEPDNVQYDPQTITSTIDSALHEACLKGEEFYNRLVKHFQKCCKEYHIKYEFYPPWKEVINATLGLSSNVKLRKMGMYTELDIYNESNGQSTNYVFQHSTSSSRRLWHDRGELSRKFGSTKSADRQRSECQDRSVHVRNTKQQHRSVCVQPVSVYELDNMVDCSATRNGDLFNTNPPATYEFDSCVSEQDLQYVGWRIPVQDENCRNWISCGRVSMGKNTAQYQPEHINDDFGVDCVRLGHGGSQAVRVNHNINDRPKEHHVPLSGFRRERSNNVWRIFRAVRNDATKHVINRFSAGEHLNLVARRPIVYSGANHSTCNYNIDRRTRFSGIVVPRRAVAGSIYGCSSEYSADQYYEHIDFKLWCGEVRWTAIDTGVHTFALVPEYDHFQWRRSRTTGGNLDRSCDGCVKTFDNRQQWKQHVYCTRFVELYFNNCNHNAYKCQHSNTGHDNWFWQTILSTSNNHSNWCNYSKCCYSATSCYSLPERIDCGVQTCVQFSECIRRQRKTVNCNNSSKSDSANDQSFDWRSQGIVNSWKRIPVCIARQGNWFGCCVSSVEFEWIVNSNTYKYTSAVSAGQLYYRASGANFGCRSCTNECNVCAEQFVVLNQRQEVSSSLLQSGGAQGSKDEPTFLENVCRMSNQRSYKRWRQQLRERRQQRKRLRLEVDDVQQALLNHHMQEGKLDQWDQIHGQNTQVILGQPTMINQEVIHGTHQRIQNNIQEIGDQEQTHYNHQIRRTVLTDKVLICQARMEMLFLLGKKLGLRNMVLVLKLNNEEVRLRWDVTTRSIQQLAALVLQYRPQCMEHSILLEKLLQERFLDQIKSRRKTTNTTTWSKDITKSCLRSWVPMLRQDCHPTLHMAVEAELDSLPLHKCSTVLVPILLESRETRSLYLSLVLLLNPLLDSEIFSSENVNAIWSVSAVQRISRSLALINPATSCMILNTLLLALPITITESYRSCVLVLLYLSLIRVLMMFAFKYAAKIIARVVQSSPTEPEPMDVDSIDVEEVVNDVKLTDAATNTDGYIQEQRPTGIVKPYVDEHDWHDNKGYDGDLDPTGETTHWILDPHQTPVDSILPYLIWNTAPYTYEYTEGPVLENQHSVHFQDEEWEEQVLQSLDAMNVNVPTQDIEYVVVTPLDIQTSRAYMESHAPVDDYMAWMNIRGHINSVTTIAENSHIAPLAHMKKMELGSAFECWDHEKYKHMTHHYLSPGATDYEYSLGLFMYGEDTCFICVNDSIVTIREIDYAVPFDQQYEAFLIYINTNDY